MKRHGLFLSTILLLVAGCATTPPYNPFKIDQGVFYENIKTIALAPIALPKGTEDPKWVRANFESAIENKLREAGFSVVPSREYEKIWKRMTKQVGTFFDPITGKKDEAKYKAVQEESLRELSAEFKADAVLSPYIATAKARFHYGMAHWDGAKEKFSSPGDRSYGTAPALSLVIRIKDMRGTTLYVNRGGVQLAQKPRGREFVPVSKHTLLNDKTRNEPAVNIALSPLSGKTLPKETPE